MNILNQLKSLNTSDDAFLPYVSLINIVNGDYFKKSYQDTFLGIDNNEKPIIYSADKLQHSLEKIFKQTDVSKKDLKKVILTKEQTNKLNELKNIISSEIFDFNYLYNFLKKDDNYSLMALVLNENSDFINLMNPYDKLIQENKNFDQFITKQSINAFEKLNEGNASQEQKLNIMNALWKDLQTEIKHNIKSLIHPIYIEQLYTNEQQEFVEQSIKIMDLELINKPLEITGYSIIEGADLKMFIEKNSISISDDVMKELKIRGLVFLDDEPNDTQDYVVAHTGKEIAGILSITDTRQVENQNDKDEDNVLYVSNVAVSQKARGLGLGFQLFKKFLDYAKDQKTPIFNTYYTNNGSKFLKEKVSDYLAHNHILLVEGEDRELYNELKNVFSNKKQSDFFKIYEKLTPTIKKLKEQGLNASFPEDFINEPALKKEIMKLKNKKGYTL
jgi:ribosomal protein S18 acetylase RimI-like enzyme/uncharacterized protein YozE (UPF0346 family)